MKWLFFVLVGVVVAAAVWQVRGGGKVSLGQGGGPMGLGPKVQAAGFEKGGEWINSDPLVLEELLAREDVKAVLVDFWTYSCINCQRTIPYLKQWWEKYQDKGLVMVGVHTPEFEFEKVKENVIAATEKYGVGWPVVQDNDYGIWTDYDNHYWPRKYLVNKDGYIVYDHVGEGGYEETEREIQKLLGVEEMAVTEEPSGGSVGFGMQQTPELYVTKRGQVSGQIGKGPDRVELVGDWQVGEDYAEAGEGAGLKLNFQAGEMNLVMSQEEEGKNVQVSVDGQSQDDIKVVEDDLYQLWTGEFGRHMLEMTFEAGTRVHAFTFGR